MEPTGRDFLCPTPGVGCAAHRSGASARLRAQRDFVVIDREPWRLAGLHRLGGLELLFCCHSSLLLFSFAHERTAERGWRPGPVFLVSWVPTYRIGNGRKKTTQRKDILLLQFGRNESGRGLLVRRVRWRRRIASNRRSAATPDLVQGLANQELPIR